MPQLDDLPDTDSECRHCRLILAELRECQPITPWPPDWGAIPSWGSASQVAPGHPIAAVDDCVCKCHSAWRMLTGNRL